MNYITGAAAGADTSGTTSGTASGSDFNAVPETDATVDLGTSTKRFRDGNFVNVVADAVSAGSVVIPRVRFPLVPFTAADDDRVFASPGPTGLTAKWRAYDNVYGQNALGSDKPNFDSWFSDQTSVLQVDGVGVTGAYNYFDVGAGVVTSFQIYCAADLFPTDYHIIGSNNQTDWTSLHYTATTEQEATYLHNGAYGAYTSEISVVNATSYKYVGILITAGEDAGFRGVQELLLWGSINVASSLVLNTVVTDSLAAEINLLRNAVRAIQGGSTQTKIRYPVFPLTSADDALVFASMEVNISHPKWQAYDNVYGLNSLGSLHAGLDGWSSATTSSFQINTVATTGSHNYIDLSATPPVITVFQFYCASERFPVEYHLIGSNDQTNWNSLYHTTQAVKEAVYSHGSIPGAYSAEIHLVNTIPYRYVGVFIITGEQTSNYSIQELLLWGTGSTVVQSGSTVVQPTIRFPSVPFTIADESKVFASHVFTGYDKYAAFDDVYGTHAIGVVADANEAGWFGNVPSAFTLAGTTYTADWIYLDLVDNPTSIITRFQVYAVENRFPVEFHIVASNDATTWTSLYYTPTSIKDTAYAHGGVPGAYSAIINLPNTTHYRYIGILILESAGNTMWKAVQELLLWGTE